MMLAQQINNSVVYHYHDQEVPKENVDVHIVSTDYAYAIVDLKDETQKQQLLDSLASLDNVLTIFDLSAITNDLGKFRVAEKTSRSNSRHRYILFFSKTFHTLML